MSSNNKQTDYSANDIKWDLSTFFNSPSDPNIEKSWIAIETDVDNFVASYRGKINSSDVTAQRISSSIKEYEDICVSLVKILNYAHMLFSADTGNMELGAFMQAQQERYTKSKVKLIFFSLELKQIPENVFNTLASDPLLNNYRHFLEETRKYIPHTLSEPEEIIYEECSNTGGKAWVRFYEELNSTHTYTYTDPYTNDTEELAQSRIMVKLRSPDRTIRQAAADAFANGLKKIEKTVVFVYNNIMLERMTEDRLRKFEYPQNERHLSNELTKEVVDLVISMCHENYHQVETYYNAKRELLKLDKLTHIDRYAPLFDTTEVIPYNKAKDIVLTAFKKYHETMYERGKEFFDKNWIDAAPNEGKRGGAFCSYFTPDTHPVILMSYVDKQDDVKTLAHELGHGIHASLSRKQTYFNYQGTLPLAELASTFCEMLVFEDLMESASKKDQLALLAAKIEDSFATIYRQAAMYSFECNAHEMRRSKGELLNTDLSNIWQTQLQKMFGKSLELGDQHAHWWLYVGHFFYAPFYVYAYSFGELLALAVYQKSRVEGKEFSNKYIEVLELGGLENPYQLMNHLGIDLNSREFWQGGFNYLQTLLDRFIDTKKELQL